MQLNISAKIREKILANASLSNKLEGRIFPGRKAITEIAAFPTITMEFIGGFPDKDGYKANTILMEIRYMSKLSIDQAIEIANDFYDIINKESFMNSATSEHFQMQRDTYPMDATDFFGGTLIYMMSDIWKIQSVG